MWLVGGHLVDKPATYHPCGESSLPSQKVVMNQANRRWVDDGVDHNMYWKTQTQDMFLERRSYDVKEPSDQE